MTGAGGRKALTRLALIAAGLIACELGLRAFHAIRGSRPRAEIEGLLGRVEGWQEPLTGEEGEPPDESLPPILDPFLGWSTERLAWRLANQAATFTEDDYEILILGGSIAAGLASIAAEDLEVVVAEDPRFEGRAVRVVHLARGGFKQPHQLHLLSTALDHGWRPDAVINLDGFNELAISAQNVVVHGVHPSQPAFYIWGPLMRGLATSSELRAAAFAIERERLRARELAGPQPLGLQHSEVFASFTAARLREVVLRFETARDAYLEVVSSEAAGPSLSGAPFEPGFEAALDFAVRSWSESSRSLHAICAARSIAYLHVLQPTLHDEGSKPLTPAEVAAGELGPEVWVRAAREGYPRLRAEGARLREQGVPFHDATQLFADDERTLYYDMCHFGGPGQYALASDIARAFLASLP